MINQNGQSLIQVMISAAVMMIIMFASASMMNNMQKENRAVTEKMAAVDLQRFIAASLADGSVCNYILNNPTPRYFDSTQVSAQTPQALTPSLPIYASVVTTPSLILGPVVAQVGAAPSPYAPNEVIQSIALQVDGASSPPPPPGPNASFTGHWMVNFNPNLLVRAIHPISIATTLTADTSHPASAKITGCQGNNGSTAASGKVGQPCCNDASGIVNGVVMMGTDDKSPYCCTVLYQGCIFGTGCSYMRCVTPVACKQ